MFKKHRQSHHFALHPQNTPNFLEHDSVALMKSTSNNYKLANLTKALKMGNVDWLVKFTWYEEEGRT